MAGECFEEHVDPTELFGLEGPQRFAVWVVLDENGQPLLRYFPGRRTRLYETESVADWLSTARLGNERVQEAGLSFRGGVILPSELSGDQGRKLVDLATGDAQASRHWRKVQSGSATGALTLVRQGVFTGKQAQQIKFISGDGELGIDNAGLFRSGINLVGGKPYEGILRIKSDAAQTVFVSLRAENGRVLAEQPLVLAARPGEYQRLSFNLTPGASDPRGRFALTLKQPGTITVDYAFLQAGEWDRYQGLPVRKELAEAMLGMGVKTMRYNGSTVNRCPDGAKVYKWKKMIGPRDERPPYHGFFNAYASLGFTVFDLMDFCEAAGLWPMFGLRTDETEQDMADLIDYCLGGPETTWGRHRIADGHPKPYFLKAIQIGNEEPASPDYFTRVKDLGGAIWSKNRDLDVVLSINVGRRGNDEGFADLAHWCQGLGQEKHLVLDSHYLSAISHADTGLAAAAGLELQRKLAMQVPGFNLRLWPMEENGDRCTWERGLAHAHNLNTMNRMPAALERAGVANTFQAWNLALVWDQGRIHFTPSQVFFQPSYYVDRMFADEWLPLVVPVECESKTLDVLAKKSRDGKVLTIYLVNIAEASGSVSIQLSGFTPRAVRATCIHAASLNAKNTPGSPATVVSRLLPWTWDAANPRLELPAYSFTTIRLTRKKTGNDPDGQLFSLAVDPGETNNMLARHPDKAEEIAAGLKQIRQNNQGGKNARGQDWISSGPYRWRL